MKKIALALSVFALTACGGDGGGDVLGGSSQKLDGVWKASLDEGADGIDEVYFTFTNNGLFTIYDYAGDSYDNAGNCYWIENALYKSKGDNEYEITFLESEIEDEDTAIFSIKVSGNTMTISDVSESVEEPLKLTKSNLKESDFTPECALTSNATSSKNDKKSAAGIFPFKTAPKL